MNMNIIEIIKELALIEEMRLTVPTFMQVDQLVIGATDIYGNTVAVYEDPEDCNKAHMIFSRDHRCVAHYVINEETKIIVINEDDTFGTTWTTMYGLVCDISNLMEKSNYVFVNKPQVILPLKPETEEVLRQIIKYNVENCTNVLHLDELIDE